MGRFRGWEGRPRKLRCQGSGIAAGRGERNRDRQQEGKWGRDREWGAGIGMEEQEVMGAGIRGAGSKGQAQARRGKEV